MGVEGRRTGDAAAGRETEAARGSLHAAVDAEAITTLLLGLAAADSTNPGGTEAETVRRLRAALLASGADVELTEAAPGRPNLLAALGGGGEPGVLFLGHSDVVPAGPGWSGNPFDPRIEDGRVIARGSCDMKGALAVIAHVMALLSTQLPALGLRTAGPVLLACTVDEEDLGIGIRAFVSGEGRALPALRGCVVAEPTDLDVVVACRGDAYLEVDVTGVPAHSGRPGDGRNAIDAAGRILALLREDQADLDAGPDPVLGAGSWNAGRIEGGRGSSIVAPDAHLWLDRRLLPGEDAAQIADALQARIDRDIAGDGIGATVRVTMSMPGFATDRDAPLARAGADAVGRARPGNPPTIDVWSAACDGGYVARDLGIDTIVLGPGDITGQAHQADESIAIAELLEATHAYLDLVLDLVGLESLDAGATAPGAAEARSEATQS